MDTIMFFVLIIIQLELGFSLQGVDFILESPKKVNVPRALLVDSEGDRIKHVVTTEFSFCIWAFINEVQHGENVAIVSYASVESGQANELLLEIVYKKSGNKNIPPYTSLSVHGSGIPFVNAVPPRNQWTHLCCTGNAKGRFKYYVDGNQAARRGQPEAIKISGDGYFILGQDQDKPNGGFQPEEGIQGRVTEFNMWDKELSKDEVKLVHDCKLQGNVVDWRNATWGLYGNIHMGPTTSPCAIVTCRIPAKPA